MASRTSFDKLQRERRKKAKAAAKRARRHARNDESTQDETAEPEPERGDPGEAIGPQELLRRVASLQSRLENRQITLEQFEEEKAELTDRLAQIMD